MSILGREDRAFPAKKQGKGEKKTEKRKGEKRKREILYNFTTLQFYALTFLYTMEKGGNGRGRDAMVGVSGAPKRSPFYPTVMPRLMPKLR
ncbi:MAG: hypothetical protein J6T64_01165 [Bacteroidaceae bacterium]|nr:hypothetical protein [Bacteroidaceae bacterium]MBR4338465.1 hypothetical protein [Bacteroidaceae bacterium]